MLHGDAVVQICTFEIGSALVGPKFGTASGPFVVADGLGEAAGEVDAWAVGVVCTPPVTWPPPRLASTITPKIPRRMTIATATAAGRSRGGRLESRCGFGGFGLVCLGRFGWSRLRSFHGCPGWWRGRVGRPRRRLHGSGGAWRCVRPRRDGGSRRRRCGGRRRWRCGSRGRWPRERGRRHRGVGLEGPDGG